MLTLLGETVMLFSFHRRDCHAHSTRRDCHVVFVP
jgi:hypothetical protein